mgnify:CR=1 FL=1
MECQRYTPGHRVHAIQALRKYDMPGEIKRVSVLGHEGNWLTFEMDGAVHRVWNHDPERVREYHDAALTNPRTALCEIALYFTSVKLLRIGRGGWTVDLYGDPAGPSECHITDHPPLNYI